jgi:hypothetical protein
MVECKCGDAEADRSLRHLNARVPGVEAWQISGTRTPRRVMPSRILPPAKVHRARLIARPMALD